MCNASVMLGRFQRIVQFDGELRRQIWHLPPIAGNLLVVDGAKQR